MRQPIIIEVRGGVVQDVLNGPPHKKRRLTLRRFLAIVLARLHNLAVEFIPSFHGICVVFENQPKESV